MFILRSYFLSNIASKNWFLPTTLSLTDQLLVIFVTFSCLCVFIWVSCAEVTTKFPHFMLYFLKRQLEVRYMYLKTNKNLIGYLLSL